MSAWYAINRSVLVRRCLEVETIAAKIRERCDRDCAVNLVPSDAEIDEFSLEGAGGFAAGSVLMLDQSLESLGSRALEAAVLTGQYENEPREVMIAPTAKAGATGLCHHRLHPIKLMLPELTGQDRQSLVTLLRELEADCRRV